MEYKKNTEKFSFGFGNIRTAGIGKISEVQQITVKLSKKSVARKAVTAGVQAMAVAVAVGLKIKFSGK